MAKKRNSNAYWRLIFSMFTTKDAALLMSSFSVYKGILHRTVPNAFYRLLCAYDAPPVEFARAWGNFSPCSATGVTAAIFPAASRKPRCLTRTLFPRRRLRERRINWPPRLKRLSNAILRLSSRSALLPPSTCWTLPPPGRAWMCGGDPSPVGGGRSY